MKFFGSAAVAVVVLCVIDELFNNGRFTGAAIVVLRNVLASIGLHF
jgi:hypothetical protein